MPGLENLAKYEEMSNYPRTASAMDGTLHTDLAGFENFRDIKYKILTT